MSVWEARLRRIDDLLERWPFAGQVLGFYKALTRFQQTVTAETEGFAPALLALVEKEGPPPLAERAGALRSFAEKEWKERLHAEWEGDDSTDPLDAFFIRVLLQPSAHERALQWKQEGNTPGAPSGRCPFCRHLPIVSLLRDDPQADATARSLVCSLCFHEWSFTRVACPQCGEESADKLPRYTAQEIPWVRIEACDACHHYLKAVDLTKDGHADPVADEAGATPLDLLAHERKLTKIQPNILGI